MIISENIKTWAKKHSLQETLHLLSTGETVYFIQEDMRTTDSIAPTVLTAAYMYFEVERERRSMIASAVYKRKAAAGEYTPRDYFGFEPGTFIPSADRKYIVEMFLEASQGIEPDEIAEWLNDCGLTTVRGNPFTPRSVRAILANPVYCGDVMFKSAGRTVRDHHESLVSRELWERANAVDKETTEQVKVA